MNTFVAVVVVVVDDDVAVDSHNTTSPKIWPVVAPTIKAKKKRRASTKIW